MIAKVENYCAQKQNTGKQIVVDAGEKVCLNCIWYEPYYRQNRGNVYAWVRTCTGCCLLREKLRGPLCRSCGEFEREGTPCENI